MGKLLGLVVAVFVVLVLLTPLPHAHAAGNDNADSGAHENNTSTSYVKSLNPDNYYELTLNKEVFLKFFSPWVRHESVRL